MIPRSLLAVVAALVLAGAACGPGTPGASVPASPSGSAATATCPTTPAPQGTPDGWDPGAQDPSIYPQIINPPGTLACGPNRLMFSFLDAQNLPVASPDRTVDVALFDLGADPSTPVLTGTATFIWAIEPTVGVYVFEAEIPAAGVWGAEFRTAVADAAPETIRVGFDVQPESTVLAVGEKAPSVKTPTLADVGGDVAKISTDDAPVQAFYETSIDEALAAGKPFVVVFATPKFCRTAQCGPTLDRVKPIAAAHPGVTFINVEPYQLEPVDGQLQPVLSGQPPDLTAAPATDAWRLRTEPWVFVVDRDGVVTASLMLIFSDEELEAAVAAVE
ncbi:MAG: hypothetical protein H0W22_08055 [Chloroflexi bacterium]|nr:hypothetical protein [Chloroflexota bacterium]